MEPRLRYRKSPIPKVLPDELDSPHVIYASPGLAGPPVGSLRIIYRSVTQEIEQPEAKIDAAINHGRARDSAKDLRYDLLRVENGAPGIREPVRIIQHIKHVRRTVAISILRQQREIRNLWASRQIVRITRRMRSDSIGDEIIVENAAGLGVHYIPDRVSKRHVVKDEARPRVSRGVVRD